MNWREEYMGRYYRSIEGWKDGTAEFFDMLVTGVPASAKVLELGPGPANAVTAFLSENFKSVDGLDIDPACSDNIHLREVLVYDGGSFPVDDDGYDAVVCNYVLEHVENPEKTVAEIRRVLRPGGVFAFRTPNRFHYVSLISALTPHWFHRLAANRARKLEGDTEDPYPTFYRMNTSGKIRKLFENNGFAELVLRTIEKEPSYGMFHPAVFLLFMLYERVVNR